jgi:hypothetical protein
MKLTRASLLSGLAATLLAAAVASAAPPPPAPPLPPMPATPVLAPMPPGHPGQRPVLVELFTSQGCASCPPADELLGRLATRPDVIAVTLPVTYWDMLGWRDTLASERNTQRQKAYAQAMGRGGVYTPQVIVDGTADVVGSREGDVEAAIAKRQAEIEVAEARQEQILAAREAAVEEAEARLEEAQAEREKAEAEREAAIERAQARIEAAAAQNDSEAAREQAEAQREQVRAQVVAYREAVHQQVDAEHAQLIAQRREEINAVRDGHVSSLAIPIAVTESPTEMHIAVAGAPDKSQHTATIWLFHLRNSVTVQIRSGENDGRTMTYHNVVADLRPVGIWKGNPLTVALPRADLAQLPHDAVAVVIQGGNGYGHVMGATLISHPDYAPER